MDNSKTVLTSAITTLVVFVLAWVLLGSGPVGPQGPAGENGRNGQNVGAAASPDFISNYISVGGRQHYSQNTTALNAASTTACSVQSPAATSTLRLGSGARFDTSSTTAVAWRVFKAATPDTNTTFLFGANIGASVTGTVAATTSADTFVFGPSQWINVIGSGGTGTYTPVGSCSFSWDVL